MGGNCPLSPATTPVYPDIDADFHILLSKWLRLPFHVLLSLYTIVFLHFPTFSCFSLSFLSAPKSSHEVCSGSVANFPARLKYRWVILQVKQRRVWAASESYFGHILRLKKCPRVLCLTRTMTRLHFTVQSACIKWRLAMSLNRTPRCKRLLMLRLQKSSEIKRLLGRCPHKLMAMGVIPPVDSAPIG